MAYTFNTTPIGAKSVVIDGLAIPLDPANRHYQEVLDAIIEQGTDCFDGDIPEDLQAAADAKLASGAYNANKV